MPFDPQKDASIVRDTAASGPRVDEVVIDFVHLARQTCGDQGLEWQLLDLFVQRSSLLIHNIAGSTSLDARRDFAHGLKGSALAIGAKKVARAAANYEGLAAHAATEADLSIAFGVLAGAVEEARGTIETLRLAA